MSYGWSFFQVCIDELNESELQQTKLQAFAHRVSMSDDFEDYMKVGEEKKELTFEEAKKLMERPLQ